MGIRDFELGQTAAQFPEAKRRIGKFVKGPVPVDWLRSSAICGRKGLHVAIAIRYLSGFVGADAWLALTPSVLAQFGVTAETSRSILKRMEAEGLVEVQRHRGRAARVKIVESEGK